MDEPLVSGALSLALCALHKQRRRFLSSRIAVVTPTADHPFFLTSQYMNLMNAFFTSQKLDVLIDVAACKWPGGGADDSGSSILRQGCDITGGSYLSLPKPDALLQYLMVGVLPQVLVARRVTSTAHPNLASLSSCSGSCFRTKRRDAA